jgi:hypothetical protein
MTGSGPGLRIEIRIKGQIDCDWSDWLGDLAVDHLGHGNTTLSGVIPDQAALYGLVFRLQNLGLSLISVSSLELRRQI